jgi:peroxiredoxin
MKPNERFVTTRRLRMRALIPAMAFAVVAASPLRSAATTGATALSGARETLASHPLASLDGKPITLSSFRGNVVVVNFWASWCAPCRKELATLDEWNAAWTDRGAKVIAVSVDEEIRNARRFVERERLSLTVLHDGPDGLARSLDIPSLPCTFVIDREGDVVGVHRGSSAEGLRSLRAEVETILRSGAGLSGSTAAGRTP